MSYKDLEAEIARWHELELLAQQKQNEIKARKEFRRQKNKRGPVSKPERPPQYLRYVTLLVEPKVPAPINMFRTYAHWADQSTTVVYEIDSLSSVAAELEAIKIASTYGWIWLKTLGNVEKQS